MIITVVSRSRCPICGCFLSSYAFPSVRVNKRSIRQLDGRFIWCAPGRCPECGWDSHTPQSFAATPWRPDAKSWAEIEVYRARRWPLHDRRGAP